MKTNACLKYFLVTLIDKHTLVFITYITQSRHRLHPILCNKLR